MKRLFIIPFLLLCFACDNATVVELPSKKEVVLWAEKNPDIEVYDNTIIQTYPNKDAREYHVSYEVSELQAKRVEKIAGVIDTSIRKYSLSVYKGKVFKWDEIEPSVLAILKDGLSKAQAAK